eukprot:4314076-Alexandrium_andersonii.AAC.1
MFRNLTLANDAQKAGRRPGPGIGERFGQGLLRSHWLHGGAGAADVADELVQSHGLRKGRH